MSTVAEVLALHQFEFENKWYCTCGAELAEGNDASMAAHQADAVTTAGLAVIELPSVAHKGPSDTEAKFFRQVAERMDKVNATVSYLSGSNVRRAVQTLLYRAADAAEAVAV